MRYYKLHNQQGAMAVNDDQMWVIARTGSSQWEKLFFHKELHRSHFKHFMKDKGAHITPREWQQYMRVPGKFKSTFKARSIEELKEILNAHKNLDYSEEAKEIFISDVADPTVPPPRKHTFHVYQNNDITFDDGTGPVYHVVKKYEDGEILYWSRLIQQRTYRDTEAPQDYKISSSSKPAYDWVYKWDYAGKFESVENAVEFIHRYLYPFHYPEKSAERMQEVWSEESGWHPYLPPEVKVMTDDQLYHRVISLLVNEVNNKNRENEHVVAEFLHYIMTKFDLYVKEEE